MANLLRDVAAGAVLARLVPIAKRIEEQLLRANDIAERSLKLELIKVGITPEALAEAEVGLPEEGPAAEQVLQQTPEELAELDAAAEHAAARLGGKVPDSLDLYAEAELMAADNPEEEP